jgi:hypothetical protein
MTWTDSSSTPKIKYSFYKERNKKMIAQAYYAEI